MDENPIALANDKVSISQALMMIGMDIPDYQYGSGKLYCPFGDLYHADGGTSKAFRVYPETNSAYCFACGEAFRPVSLLAKAKGISDADAAEGLLEAIGYVPPTIDSRWEALITTPQQIDREALSEALKLACSRMSPTWEVDQFDELIATRFRKCLELLSKVHTEEEATQWLTVTKAVMRKTLNPEE